MNASPFSDVALGGMTYITRSVPGPDELVYVSLERETTFDVQALAKLGYARVTVAASADDAVWHRIAEEISRPRRPFTVSLDYRLDDLHVCRSRLARLGAGSSRLARRFVERLRSVVPFRSRSGSGAPP